MELTEQDVDDDLNALAHLRAAGIALALDDAAAGSTGVERILRVAPDLVKIDGPLLHAAQTSAAADALLHTIVDAAITVGAELVAEGIEGEVDLLRAMALRASLGQGYALGRPLPVEHYLVSRQISA